jgi:hypothetical protein
MKPAVKIAIYLLGMASIAVCSEWNSTGDLIMALRSQSQWPPLALTRPQLNYFYDSPSFRIHYDKAGPYAVYHPDEDVNPMDGVPDYVNRMSEYLESSYDVYINGLGYDVPPPDEGSGGNNKYDIYVTDITGRTVPEFPSNYYPGRMAYSAYSNIGNDLRTHNHPDDPLPFLKATCAHEYFHAVQMAYRAYTDETSWWWYELTATWAEEQVFDDLNEVYYYIRDYYDKINRSLYLTGGDQMYGAWVFAEYLSENYGSEIIKSVFERLITLDLSLYAIEATLDHYGLSLGECFSRFSVWNYFTGINWRPGFFEEGMDFPVSVPIAMSHNTYPTPLIETPKAVENLGCAYIFFANPNIAKANLTICFAAYDHPLDLAIEIIYNDRPPVYCLRKVERGQQVTIRILDFIKTDGVVMAINWPYQGITIYDSAGYSYFAAIDTLVSGLDDQYSEIPDKFEITNIYPNPFNSSCRLNFNWNLAPIDYTIKIYDIGGRLVDSFGGHADKGDNQSTWTPRSDFAGGVYFYRLSIGGVESAGKMVYLK